MSIKRTHRNWNISAQTELLRPLRGEASGDHLARRIFSVQLFTYSLKERIDRFQKILRRESTQGSVPHPLVTHGTDRTRSLRGIFDITEHGGEHVAMFEGCDESTSSFRIMAQPVQQFRETPFGGINTAAPLDRCQIQFVGCLGDKRGLAPCPMVAPEVIVIERFQLFP